MAIVSVQVRLPTDPDPANSPPDAIEPYPPNKLVFITGDKHFADISDVLNTDYILDSSATSSDRWLRLEASGLTADEVVDNIKIWIEDSPAEDIP